jgi:ataxia telangiectasia mutated family protein
LTVVEVFIHDPLYRWTLSPLQALRLQRRDEDGSVMVLDKTSSEKSVLDAERTLLRLKQKLQGYESGQALSVSRSFFLDRDFLIFGQVPGQVQQLINLAMDPAVLCKMFEG